MHDAIGRAIAYAVAAAAISAAMLVVRSIWRLLVRIGRLLVSAGAGPSGGPEEQKEPH